MINIKKTVLAFLPAESLEMSCSFPNNLLIDAIDFYSKALYYGYDTMVNAFQMEGSKRVNDRLNRSSFLLVSQLLDYYPEKGIT